MPVMLYFSSLKGETLMVFKLVLEGLTFWTIATPILWLSYSPGKLVLLGKVGAVWERLSHKLR